jgi:hypothetical protein
MHFGLTLELVRGFEVTTSSCPHAAELTTSVCKLYSLIMEYELIVSRSKQSEHETCMTRVTTRVSCSFMHQAARQQAAAWRLRLPLYARGCKYYG